MLKGQNVQRYASPHAQTLSRFYISPTGDLRKEHIRMTTAIFQIYGRARCKTLTNSQHIMRRHQRNINPLRKCWEKRFQIFFTSCLPSVGSNIQPCSFARGSTHRQISSDLFYTCLTITVWPRTRRKRKCVKDFDRKLIVTWLADLQ